MIELKSLKKRYVSKKGVVTDALDGIDLRLGKGLTFIVGKTGCGKSTLLNILGKLEEPDEGQVFVDGLSLKNLNFKQGDDYRNRYVGFVFQEYNLMDELTVEENVTLACKLQGRAAEKEKIEGLFERLGLTGMESKHPDELSGGQKQRVAIARALIKNPRLILADEPTGALDGQTGEEILNLLREISSEIPVVAVSHNLDFAEKYGDRIVELSDGRVVSDKKKTDAEESKKEKKENENFATKEKRKKTLGLRECFRFVRINFGHRGKRLAAMLVVSAFFLSLSGVVYTSFFFNDERVLANTWRDNDVPRVMAVNALNRTEEGFFNGFAYGDEGFLSEENIKELSRKSERKAYPFFKYFSDVYSEGSSESGFSFGYNYGPYSNDLSTFYYSNLDYILGGMEIDAETANALGVGVMAGRLPEKQDEIAVSDYMYEMFAYWGYRHCEVNGDIPDKSETKKIESTDDLIGKTIRVENKCFTVTGVLNVGDKSKYELLKRREYTDEAISLGSVWEKELKTSLNAVLFVAPGYYDAVVRPAYEAREYSKNAKLFLYSGKGEDSSWLGSDDIIAPVANTEKQENMPEIIWKNGASVHSLSDNQIVMKVSVDSLGAYKIDGKLFGDIFDGSGYSDSKTELNFKNLKPYAERIFKDYSKVYVRLQVGSYSEKSYEVVGIFCDEKAKRNEETGDWITAKKSSVNLYFSDSEYGNIVDFAGLYEFKGAFMPLNGNNSDYRLLRALDEEGEYFLTDRYSAEVADMSNVMGYVSKIGSWFALAFLLINGVMLGNYISVMIADKRRQIGILRVLGAGKKELLGIFGTEGILLSLVAAFTGTLGTCGLSALANFLLKRYTSRFVLSLISIGFGEIALIFLSAVSVGIAASCFPVAKSAKTKPVDALRQE